MDAAEGDSTRSAEASSRPTGWRVPSTPRTKSSLPIDWHHDEPGRIARVVARPSGTETNPETESSPPMDQTDVSAEPMTPSRRRWSLRRRSREPEPFDSVVPDIDLVALAADDERIWDDAALAALEEPEPADSVAPRAAAEEFTLHAAYDEQWLDLTEDQPHSDLDDFTFTAPASDGEQPTGLPLEQEFWA